MTEEHKIQLRKNIDSKILKMYVTGGKSLTEIQRTLTEVNNSFKNLINEGQGSTRQSIISYYSEFTDKRVKDLEYIKQSYKQLNINNNDVRNN